jgi:uncharacterized RDD family membrane protein YckC
VASAASICPSCGTSLAAEAKFCAECGDQLSGEIAAGFWIRFGAVLIDAVILIVVLVVLSAIADTTGYFLGLAIGIAYTVGFWVSSGATPGKMVFGLKVVTVDGDPIGIGTALLRYFGYWVNALTLYIGYLFIAFRKDKRGLHDLIASTKVIRAK